jgi:hypothetical protein
LVDGSRVDFGRQSQLNTKRCPAPKEIRLQEIYGRNTSFLRHHLEAYARGEPFNSRAARSRVSGFVP